MLQMGGFRFVFKAKETRQKGRDMEKWHGENPHSSRYEEKRSFQPFLVAAREVGSNSFFVLRKRPKSQCKIFRIVVKVYLLRKNKYF